MKKSITCITLVLFVIIMCMSFTACSDETPVANPPVEYAESVSEGYGLLVFVGQQINIDGKLYNASALRCKNGQSNEFYVGEFAVNRVTGAVFIVDLDSSSSKYDSAFCIETGLFWTEDTITVNGTIVPMLNH